MALAVLALVAIQASCASDAGLGQDAKHRVLKWRKRRYLQF